MNDFEQRWQRLVAASRRTTTPDPPPPSPAFVERMARRGLEARASGPLADGRASEPWAWAGLLALTSTAVLLLVWARPPLQHEAAAMAEELVRLPDHLPAAPELPAPFHLPPAPQALAVLPDGPALRSALGLPSFHEATP